MCTITMNVESDLVEPVTPALAYDNASFWKAEDSGYHTSGVYTPGSLECSEILTENLDPSIIQRTVCITGQIHVDGYDITPELNFRFGRKYGRTKRPLAATCNEIFTESSVIRRGVKRPYQESSDASECSYDSVPTPTSQIAGGLQRLKVNDNKLNECCSISSVHTDYLDANNVYYSDGCTQIVPFPTTPVKRICKSGSKVSPRVDSSAHKSSPLRVINNIYCPAKRSVKKLNFAIDSLSCETQGLQPIIKRRPELNVVRMLQFRPDQKIDIIKMLYQKVCCMPAIIKIFDHLSNEDIYNFSLVSHTWLQVSEDVSKARSKKQEHLRYLRMAKENQENKERGVTPRSGELNQIRSMKEIHNILNTHAASSPTRTSPPGTPRTIRFKRFTKSASLDSRIQLFCVRCRQPAKVTEETSGEQWVECTSTTCSYQFCRHCKCDRHPGRNCFQYDLEGPSPSKRKKTSCILGSKKSRKNLRRLL